MGGQVKMIFLLHEYLNGLQEIYNFKQYTIKMK